MYRPWRKASKKIFNEFDLCLAQNDKTCDYLKILGAKNIRKIGNLKFSQSKLELKNKSNPRIKKFLINKKIPQKSGMGGGSMNAASILKYFLRKKKFLLKKKEIEKISN